MLKNFSLGSFASSLIRACGGSSREFLTYMGADVKVFDPTGLPLFDQMNSDHNKIPGVKGTQHVNSEGQV